MAAGQRRIQPACARGAGHVHETGRNCPIPAASCKHEIQSLAPLTWPDGQPLMAQRHRNSLRSNPRV
jgi:hypothetical protein